MNYFVIPTWAEKLQVEPAKPTSETKVIPPADIFAAYDKQIAPKRKAGRPPGSKNRSKP